LDAAADDHVCPFRRIARAAVVLTFDRCRSDVLEAVRLDARGLPISIRAHPARANGQTTLAAGVSIDERRDERKVGGEISRKARYVAPRPPARMKAALFSVSDAASVGTSMSPSSACADRVAGEVDDALGGRYRSFGLGLREHVRWDSIRQAVRVTSRNAVLIELLGSFA
jgi:hypothetical protein